jgi:RNA polymerase sigma-70 factor (ECF subfamily)
VADSHIFAQAAPDLVKKLRQGDHAAFELFYRMEFLNLVHFAGSYLRDDERARDIAQETLLALWENHRLLNPEKNIRSFVFTIARNKTLNELRRRKLFKPTGLEDEALELLEDHSVEEQIEGLELAALIEKVWNKLPKEIGHTFSLSREEGLKNREIAAREGISEKTVEYRMRVALGRFRALFRQFV